MIETHRRVATVQEPEGNTGEKDASDDVTDGDGDDALVDVFADAEVCAVEHADGDEVEVGDAVLVAQDDERPHRDPDTVDLGHVVAGRHGQKGGQSDKPVTSHTTEEVDRPLHVHSLLCLHRRVAFDRVVL